MAARPTHGGMPPASGPLPMAALRQAGAHFRAGRFREAVEIYRDVIRRQPRVPDLHNNLGVALKAAGELKEAVPCFRRAVRLKPDYAVAHANLAGCLEALGRPVEALEHRVDAWRIDPGDLEQRDALVTALRRCPFDRPNAAARSALAALHEHPELDKQGLAGATVRLWRSNPSIAKALQAARRFYPPRSAEKPRGIKPLGDFLADPLLIAALGWSVATDPDLEAEIIHSRRGWLEELLEDRLRKIDPGWLPALALQARITEWVWPETPEETEALGRLDAETDREVESREPNRTRALIRALYRPLETDPAAAVLRTEASKLPYPETMPDGQRESDWALLLRRSFLHPHEESRVAGEVRTLTPIADDVSARVRTQYEENPYPRWLSVDRRPPRSLEAHLARVLPGAPIGPLGTAPPSILVAGCGTGRHAIQTAVRYAGCQVTAVDLSSASLAYAKRMARELGIGNIAFYQGDILALGRIPARFELIECSGVLHHLADPMAGWRVLRGLLAPGGLMRLAFYSSRARGCFDAVRAADPGPPASLKQRVLAVRQAVFDLPEGHPAQALLRTADFYATSGVRDALLHAQERTVDLSWLDQAIAALDLRFLGFELPDPSWLVAYRRRRPEDAAGLDLRAWDSVETENPSMFLGMYQFWVRAED